VWRALAKRPVQTVVGAGAVNDAVGMPRDHVVSQQSVSVAVVGAGPAGVAASAALTRAGCVHVVLEREVIGWSWRTQRWDSFRLNTPAWANRVPGRFLQGEATSFASAGAFVAALERLAHSLPVVEHVDVFSARRSGPSWRLETSRGALVADAVVVASGFQNVPRKPVYAATLPREIRQLHAERYRRADDLEDGILVVGGGQSGVQIAADLLAAGKNVHLSTSRVGRLPRRYGGRDAFEWLRDTGQLDLRREDADPEMIAATPPQISGAAGGESISYQELSRRGATLLGRALGWNGRRLELASDLGHNVRFADEASRAVKAAWEKRAQLLRRRRAVSNARDVADEPSSELYERGGPALLDLDAAGISTVIWATGFTPSTGWLPAGALDERHRPQLPGLYVVGAPWLTHRASGNLYGMVTDAERVAAAVRSSATRAAA
jgi:putative flavoprotein involved in K+ transport